MMTMKTETMMKMMKNMVRSERMAPIYLQYLHRLTVEVPNWENFPQIAKCSVCPEQSNANLARDDDSFPTFDDLHQDCLMKAIRKNFFAAKVADDEMMIRRFQNRKHIEVAVLLSVERILNKMVAVVADDCLDDDVDVAGDGEVEQVGV
jgi:hypothetical protein